MIGQDGSPVAAPTPDHLLWAHVGDVVLLLDGDGVIGAASPSCRHLLGVDPAALVATHLADLVHADERGAAQAALVAAAAAGGTPGRVMLHVRRADGSYRLMETTIAGRRDDPAVATVVTARALGSSEEELRQRIQQAELAAEIGAALTDSSPLQAQLQHCAEALVGHLDAAFARIWTVDLAEDMLVLRASAGLYTHLDGPHGRVPLGALKIGRIAMERRPHLTNCVVGDPRVSDQEWARREGMIAFAGYPLLVDEALVGVMALFARRKLTEITLEALGSVASEIALGIARAEADTARAALLRREQAARDDLETINRVGRMLSAELDPRILVQAVTDAATDLVGAQLGAFFYNTVDERGESYTLYAIAGASRDAFARFPMPRNTAIFGPTFRGEGIVRLDDVRADPRFGLSPPYFGLPPGHPPVVSYLAVPVVSRSGEVIGGLFFGHAEAGVFSGRAERIVAGLAAQAAIAMDNARLYQAAQDALRVRDEFISAVAHDLKTPLTGIKGRVQLLLRRQARSATVDVERLIGDLTTVDLAASKMAGLIDHLLDAARVASGRLPDLERQPTDLVALAEKVSHEHQQGTERHQIRVRAAVPELVGLWDTTRLERVLDNLLSNAIKYSPEGGAVTVTVSRERDASGDWAVVAVADAGAGIAPADLPRVFDRFYRGSNVSDQASGSGIGLASARQITEMHGGTIAVQSQEGAGSTFTVRLPLREDQPPAGDHAAGT